MCPTPPVSRSARGKINDLNPSETSGSLVSPRDEHASSPRIVPHLVISFDQHQPTTPSEVVSSVVSRARWDRAAICGDGSSLVVVLPPHASRTGHHQVPACPSPAPLRRRLLCHDLSYLASTVRPLLLSAARPGHRVCGNMICTWPLPAA